MEKWQAAAERDRELSARRSTRRNILLAAAGWPALAWIDAIFGQSKKPPVLIGWLSLGSRTASRRSLTDFKEGMVALGWIRMGRLPQIIKLVKTCHE